MSLCWTFNNLKSRKTEESPYEQENFKADYFATHIFLLRLLRVNFITYSYLSDRSHNIN